MELFYNENLHINDESLNLSPDESRHLSKVLRKKVGEKIRVTNGHGLEWNGELITTDSRKATAKKKGSCFTSKQNHTLAYCNCSDQK